MREKRFERELLGYSRKSVNEYIIEFDKKARIKLEDMEEEKSDILRRVMELERENAELKEEKEAVSRAIVKAEETAGRIVSDAEKRAEEMIRNAEEEAKKRSLEIEENTKAEVTALTKQIEKKRENAEQEIKALKNELKERYEKEFERIIRLRSELNLLKAAATVIVSENQSKDIGELNQCAINVTKS